MTIVAAYRALIAPSTFPSLGRQTGYGILFGVAAWALL